MSSTHLVERLEAFENLLQELDRYLGKTDSRVYSDGTRDPYEEVRQGHSLHDAVVVVQDVCFGGDPLPDPWNVTWGRFLRKTRLEEHSEERNDNIYDYGSELYGWVEQQISRLKDLLTRFSAELNCGEKCKNGQTHLAEAESPKAPASTSEETVVGNVTPTGRVIPPETVNMTVQETADYIGVVPKTIRDWIDGSGKLKATSIGSGLFEFSQKELDTHKVAQQAKKKRAEEQRSRSD